MGETVDKAVPGVLSLISLDSRETQLFLEYMDKVSPDLSVEFIYSIFGSREFLKFFDVLSGKTIRVPTRDSIKKIIGYIKIYKYCRDRGFSEDTYRKASKVFDKRLSSVKRIVSKVDKILMKGAS